RYATDVDMAVKKAVHAGLIKHEEADEYLTIIMNAMKNPVIAGWFDTKYKVLNERDILLPGSGLKRPDRLLIFNKDAVVIDYKFGKEDAGHADQVKEYCSLLTGMGYSSCGFLWYVNIEKVIKIV
ncbi:MAG: DNA helicase UvrD, partial [Bacteroidota bacterium]